MNKEHNPLQAFMETSIQDKNKEETRMNIIMMNSLQSIGMIVLKDMNILESILLILQHLLLLIITYK